MSVQKGSREPRKPPWPDEDDWLNTFREYLCGHPELAEHVARIWFALFEHQVELRNRGI